MLRKNDICTGIPNYIHYKHKKRRGCHIDKIIVGIFIFVLGLTLLIYVL